MRGSAWSTHSLSCVSPNPQLAPGQFVSGCLSYQELHLVTTRTDSAMFELVSTAETGHFIALSVTQGHT